MKSVSFLVLNWNGEKVIFRCLEAVSRALKNYEGPGEILVVDNGSRDRSVVLIEKEYPEARLIKLDKNYGFSEGNNIGVRKSRGEVVVLVNNDAYVHPNFINPLISHFNDDRVFSVTPKVYRLEGEAFFVGKTEIHFYLGTVKTKFPDDRYPSPVPCLFASGGSGAFDRKKYLELGGFLDLLYWEDLELGYRAWKRKGWQTIYEPRSLVYHDPATSFNKVFSQGQIRRIRDRNRFLFQWYSISDPLLILKHFGCLPLLLLYFSLKRKMSYPIGFFQALHAWNRFKREADRRMPKGKMKLRDREILKLIVDEGT